jgi:hypothetical protein
MNPPGIATAPHRPQNTCMNALTIDRARGGGWNVVERATGEPVAGPFRNEEEARDALLELRRVRRAVVAMSAA